MTHWNGCHPLAGTNFGDSRLCSRDSVDQQLPWNFASGKKALVAMRICFVIVMAANSHFFFLGGELENRTAFRVSQSSNQAEWSTKMTEAGGTRSHVMGNCCYNNNGRAMPHRTSL